MTQLVSKYVIYDKISHLLKNTDAERIAMLKDIFVTLLDDIQQKTGKDNSAQKKYVTNWGCAYFYSYGSITLLATYLADALTDDATILDDVARLL